MALSTPEQVQLFGKDDAPVGSGGFKLTGEAKEGDGFCRVWLRPIEAWDRALNPRMESEHWDVRAYQKLDSAFEFVPEFTLKDLEQMAENFSFSEGGDVFGMIEMNGDPVHDTVLAWARHVTGSSNDEASEGFTVREPRGRYETAKGSESLDFDRDLVFSSSSPAPLGGVAHRRPAPVPSSAKKIAPEPRAAKPSVKQAPAKEAPAKETPPEASTKAQTAKPSPVAPSSQTSKSPTPPPAQTATSSATKPASAPKPSVEKTEAPLKAESASESKPPAPPLAPPPAPPAKSASPKTTQAMSILSDDDFEDDKLAVLRERLAQRRASTNED